MPEVRRAGEVGSLWERFTDKIEFISIYDNLGLHRKEATAMGT